MVFNLNDFGLWFELPTELDELSWCGSQPLAATLLEGGCLQADLDHFSSLGFIVKLVDSHW